MSSCAAVILAAGSSSRLGQPKQLLQLDGESLLHRTARLAHEAGAAPVVIVTSPQFPPELVPDLPVVWLQNDDAGAGMSSSLRLGVSHLLRLDAVPERAMLLVCDQPRVTAEHLRKLLAASVDGSDAAAAYSGRLGTPAVFHRRRFAALRAITGDQGARSLLQTLPMVAVEMPEAALDIDTPEDLQALR